MDGVEGEKKKKSGCGCFGCGCLSILAIIVLMFIGTGYYINKMVLRFSTETPLSLTEVTGTPEEYEAINNKVGHFVAGLQGSEDPTPLVMTDRDINLWLANQPDMNEIAANLRAKIDADKIGAQFNFPLPGPWAGRYLNGEGTLKISINAGEANITIDSLSFNGSPIPEPALKEIQSKNLADEMFKKPEQKKLLDAVDLVIVKNGKLIIVAKKGGINALKPEKSGGISTGPESGAPAAGAPPPAHPPQGAPGQEGRL